MIYTVGDSHGFYAFVRIAEWHTAGWLLMHHAGAAGHLQRFVNDIPLVPGDVLIVSCGEIDVRFCIREQTQKQNADYTTVLQRTVDAYLGQVALLDVRGATVAVLSVSPPAPGEMGKPREPEVTDEQRTVYTRTMNALLRDGCAARGIPFVDTYTEVVGPDGMLPLYSSDGWTHITDTTATKRVLTRLGLMKGE